MRPRMSVGEIAVTDGRIECELRCVGWRAGALITSLADKLEELEIPLPALPMRLPSSEFTLVARVRHPRHVATHCCIQVKYQDGSEEAYELSLNIQGNK